MGGRKLWERVPRKDCCLMMLPRWKGWQGLTFSEEEGLRILLLAPVAQDMQKWVEKRGPQGKGQTQRRHEIHARCSRALSLSRCFQPLSFAGCRNTGRATVKARHAALSLGFCRCLLQQELQVAISSRSWACSLKARASSPVRAKVHNLDTATPQTPIDFGPLVTPSSGGPKKNKKGVGRDLEMDDWLSSPERVHRTMRPFALGALCYL